MELLIKSLRSNEKWRSFQKIILIFYTIYLPARLILQFGFTNPTADFFLGFLTVFAPIILFLVFPFKKFRPLLQIISAIFLGLLVLISLLFILFKFLAVQNIEQLGYDPALIRKDNYDSSHFIHQVTYVSNCGATCDFDTFQVSELVLLNLVKVRIPGTYIDQPN